jgi:RNA polymerase sigma-70 factor (ECF subfamily)
MIAKELFQRVQAILDTLPEDQRTALVLKMIHRLPYSEISDITGASVGKLKSDLHRARMEMRRKLQPYMSSIFSGRGEP